MSVNLSTYIFALLAVVCYAALSPIAKKLQLQAIPPFAFVTITMALLCIMAALASVLYERDFVVARIRPLEWTGLILFGLLNFIGFAAYLVAITKMPVVQYQLMGLIGPVVGAVLAYCLLQETFKMQYLWGMIIIAVGLYIAFRDPGTASG